MWFENAKRNEVHVIVPSQLETSRQLDIQPAPLSFSPLSYLQIPSSRGSGRNYTGDSTPCPLFSPPPLPSINNSLHTTPRCYTRPSRPHTSASTGVPSSTSALSGFASISFFPLFSIRGSGNLQLLLHLFDPPSSNLFGDWIIRVEAC
jgi:hypothetical protein